MKKVSNSTDQDLGGYRPQPGSWPKNQQYIYNLQFPGTVAAVLPIPGLAKSAVRDGIAWRGDTLKEKWSPGTL